MVLITALAKYQNPLFPYFQSDYGLGGQYQNRLWDFFGLEERFRGPYHHPNQLGIAITFLSLLVLLKPTRLYIAILPISFTLLFLASSRTSIIALMLGLLARIYFDTSSATKAHSSLMTQDLPKSHSRKKLVPKKMFIGFTVFCFAAMAVRQIIGNNTTGTGRLEAASNTISAVRQNLLLGRGPSLFSTTITENTFLTLLSYYGLIGIALSLVIAFALILKLRKMNHNVRYSFYILLTTFLIAGAGEALLTGTSQDTGLFYLLVLLTLTRVEPPSKDLQSKTPPG